MRRAQVAVREDRGTLNVFSMEKTLRSLENGTFSISSIGDLSSILHECRREKNVPLAARLHSYMQSKGLENHMVLGNNLVCMLADVGCMNNAQVVFDRQVHRNDSSWNSLIKGYTKGGEGQHALDLYKETLGHPAIQLSSSTFVAVLKACAELQDVDTGMDVYSDIARKGLLEGDVFLGTALVDMYAKCGSLATAQEVFDNLLVRDVVSWTTLITGYVQGECSGDALHHFEKMQQEGIVPDDVTYACCLKACSTVGATDMGQQIHSDIVKKGLDEDVYIGNTLIDMYSTCGSIAEALKVFDKLPRDVISWNTLIAGCVENGHDREALNTFWQMRQEHVHPEAVTFVCALKACGRIGDTDSGQQIHAEVLREDLGKNLFIASTLIDMYIRCSLLAKAQEVFDALPVQDVVSRTALLTGYTEHGRWEEVLTCYEQMQHEDVFPVTATFICALRACGSMGATDKGWEVHAQVTFKGLERDVVIGSTLLGMYTKCAWLREAQQVFDNLPHRDVVSWTTLIAGYALVGDIESVFLTLDKMLGEGMELSLVSFGHVLNACSHWGLIDEGQMYFETMIKDFGIIPTSENYTCMADLLSRAGHIDRAVLMIEHMPCHPSSVMWHAVLAACQKWSNMEAGKEAFEHAVRLDEKDYTAYVSMSNIYVEREEIPVV